MLHSSGVLCSLPWQLIYVISSYVKASGGHMCMAANQHCLLDLVCQVHPGWCWVSWCLWQLGQADIYGEEEDLADSEALTWRNCLDSRNFSEDLLSQTAATLPPYPARATMNLTQREYSPWLGCNSPWAECQTKSRCWVQKSWYNVFKKTCNSVDCKEFLFIVFWTSTSSSSGTETSSLCETHVKTKRPNLCAVAMGFIQWQ